MQLTVAIRGMVMVKDISLLASCAIGMPSLTEHCCAVYLSLNLNSEFFKKSSRLLAIISYGI